MWTKVDTVIENPEKNTMGQDIPSNPRSVDGMSWHVKILKTTLLNPYILGSNCDKPGTI